MSNLSNWILVRLKEFLKNYWPLIAIIASVWLAIWLFSEFNNLGPSALYEIFTESFLSASFLDLLSVIFAAVVFAYAWFFAYGMGRQRSQVADEELQLKAAEDRVKTTEEPQSTEQLLSTELDLAVKREMLLMRKSDIRANRMFLLGTWLAVLAILAPVLSVYTYLNVEPLPTKTIENIISLNEVLNPLPAGFTIEIKRDWRILFSGVSFGFLFLAAAASILKQEANQRKNYFQVAEKVELYEKLQSALRIIERLPEDADTEKRKSEFLTKILATLMKPPPTSNPQPEEEFSLLTAILEYFRNRVESPASVVKSIEKD